MSLFITDCVPLAKKARQDSATLAEVATLVLLSIQQPWYGMPRQFADVRAKGRDSVYLFGHKRAGYDYVHAHANELAEAAKRAHGESDLDALIMRYLDVPCLGLAKASFLAQMTIADGACLDVHNLRRLGLEPNAMRLGKTLTEASKARKVSVYNNAWRKQGDSGYWWDTWCEALLSTSYHRFNSASEVSAMHLLPLN